MFEVLAVGNSGPGRCVGKTNGQGMFARSRSRVGVPRLFASRKRPFSSRIDGRSAGRPAGWVGWLQVAVRVIDLHVVVPGRGLHCRGIDGEYKPLTHGPPERFVLKEGLPVSADLGRTGEGFWIVDEAESMKCDLWGQLAEKITLEKGCDGCGHKKELGRGAVGEKGGEIATTQRCVGRRESCELLARETGWVEEEERVDLCCRARGRGGCRRRGDWDVEAVVHDGD